MMINNDSKNNTIETQGSSAEAIRATGPMMGESLIGVLWRGRWAILATTVAALIAGFVYITRATPIYTSTSRVYVEQTGPRIMTEMEEGVMTRSKNYLYTQAELIRSTPILTAALDRPGIRQMESFAGLDNPVGYMKNSLDAVVGKKDDIISVSFKSPYPAEAAQLVNEVMDAYVTYHSTRKRSTSAEVLKILQKEKAQRSTELSEKLTAMMELRKKNINLAFEGNRGNIVLNKLERISSVLTEAHLATIEAESFFESTKQMVNDPTQLQSFLEVQQARGAYVATAGRKAQLEAHIEQLRSRLADRLRQLTAEHPAVTALNTEIDQIKAQITQLDREFVQSQLGIVEQQYLIAQEKERKVAADFDQQMLEASSLNDQLAQYTILQSEYDQARKLCDILDDRIKELNVTEDAGALNISILEVARAAKDPSEPQKARIMAIALILGLMAGGALSLIRDWMDQRIRSSEEVTAILGAPILGVIPSMPKKDTFVHRGLMVGSESSSATAEAYRTVRTALFFSVPKGKAKTVLVTSPGAGEGKSTLVSNLSIAMAQTGQQVLIIDADFRRPSQHEIFETTKELGVSGVLAGTQPLSEVIHHTSTKGLDILACGPNVVNPSELLGSEEFGALLETLAEKYDRIVIDSPPVMPVTDACILAAVSDVTLLVLRADRSTRKGACAARDALVQVDANILGVVVNDVSRKKGHYGYYGYYGYGYYDDYYGHDHKNKKSKKSETQQAAAGSSRNGIHQRVN